MFFCWCSTYSRQRQEKEQSRNYWLNFPGFTWREFWIWQLPLLLRGEQQLRRSWIKIKIKVIYHYGDGEEGGERGGGRAICFHYNNIVKREERMVGWRREGNKKFINLHTARATLLSLNSSKKLFHLSSCGCKLKGILILTTSERGWLSKLWSKTLPFSLSWVRVLHKLVWVGWRELNTHTHTHALKCRWDSPKQDWFSWKCSTILFDTSRCMFNELLLHNRALRLTKIDVWFKF